MTELFEPETADEVEAIVADALAANTPIEITGAGTKRGIGRPSETAHRLSTSRLSGVSLYEPEELVMRAGPGTPMEQIRLQLDQHGQMLAFEPPDLGPVLGHAPGEGTVGGIVAGNLSGPRRIKAGAARDHFLGVNAVSGRGELFKSGGRVVKNVTGYDLCKLMCGSWGTLGVMTEVTLKVLPAPERTRTVLVACEDPDTAVRAMTEALSSPHDVSAAAWVPSDIGSSSAVSYVSGARTTLAALRLEGFGASVEARCAALRDMLAAFGDIEELHTHNSKTFWRELGELKPFAEDTAPAVWRISVAPAAAAPVLARMNETLSARAWLDWGGGLIWLAVADTGDAGASVIRAAVDAAGGHATLIRADETTRGQIDVFHPEAEGIARLTRNLKDAFDPERILNPGRMYRDI